MLTNLQISNIVLIEKLNLEFGQGLNILTGETGAGKSILLDALALALGARSDTGLIRHGCETASVVAMFDKINQNVQSILNENGIECDNDLILRRTLTLDGKSRAWVNDTPVSIKTLKQIGDNLVEIHGQFANHALLDPTTHRGTLDEFGTTYINGYDRIINATHNAYSEYHKASIKLTQLQQMLENAVVERDFLEHNVAELRNLSPKIGEEQELANMRATMMAAEKDAGILAEATEILSPRGQSLESQICNAAHVLQRIKTDPNPFQSQINQLYDTAEIIATISQTLTPIEIDTANLDSIEERLFAIRAVARKHHVTADELPNKLKQLTEQLNTIDNSDIELRQAIEYTNKCKNLFDDWAKKLTQVRTQAAIDLRNRLVAELPDLKLAQADFSVQITDTQPSQNGADDIIFMIKTNPGMPFSPLHKAASGGELARLMLAMRVVLTSENVARTFIFDEIDTGISGATASAVGLRLNRLATDSQALVITHSAQVAGYADRHFKIEKNATETTTTTNVIEIKGDNRIAEIARIVSGSEITPESIATAKTLIK
ncbi:MAG: DNA repair protein RecN [Alphaproteobacteria bacterium]|nr:DNA repair protein RecN [Alphaproteobacteria bacterium]